MEPLYRLWFEELLEDRAIRLFPEVLCVVVDQSEVAEQRGSIGPFRLVTERLKRYGFDGSPQPHRIGMDEQAWISEELGEQVGPECMTG